MRIYLKPFVVAVAMLFGGAGAAMAWERASAPIEFVTRSAAPQRVSVAHLRPTSVTAASTDFAPNAQRAPVPERAEILYGYGRHSAVSAHAPIDLRGTLAVVPSSPSLAEDAFDDVPPTPAPGPAPEEAAVTEANLETAPPDAPARATADVAPSTDTFFVQVGAFANADNAARAKAALQDIGAVTIEERQGASAKLHRVRLGAWPSRAAAELARDLIADRGFGGAVVGGGR